MYVPRRQSQHEAGDDGEQGDHKDLEDIQRDAESATFLRRDSNRERVEEAARNYTFQAMKLIVSSNEECLDRDILIHMTRTQQERNRGLLSLPFSLLLFMMFALSAIQHEDVTNVYVIESGLRTALGKGADQIKDIKDTWTWLDQQVFPTVFNQRDFNNKPIDNKKEWSRILSYNNLQGPLFLEQERSTKALCDDGSEIAKDMYCYSTKTMDIEPYGRNLVEIDDNGVLSHNLFQITPPRADDYNNSETSLTMKQRVDWYNQPFKPVTAEGRRLRAMRPTYQGKLSGGTMTANIASEGVFRAVFSPNMRYELIRERLSYLYENGWLDAQTKHLSLRALMLNNEVGRPRIQSYKLVLSFSRAGDVFAKLTMDTIFLESHSGFIGFAADMAFALMLIFITGREIFAMWRSCRGGVFKKHIFTGKFLLDISLISLGWGVTLGYQYINMLTGTVVDDMKEVTAAREQDFPAELNNLGVDLHNSAGNVVFISAWHRLVVAMYHLVLMVRFFVAFRAQPRLGVVVNTLEVCLIDIFHFMVILLPCFCAYGIAGCFVFGRRVEEFSNISAALGVCFKIMTESEFDWPYLSQEHLMTTLIWTWSFMLFLSLVMLNLVLAIVLDVYSEQRKLAGKSDSINETVRAVFTIFRNWKRWVSNSALLDKLHKMPRMISREAFLKEFPGMPDKQADLLISGCQQLAANINAGPEHTKQTMRMAMAMKVAMDQVADSIEELDTGCYQADEFNPSASKPSWLAELSRELASQNHHMLLLQWRLQQLNWAWQAMDMAHGKGTKFTLDAAGMKQQSDLIL